MTNIDEWLENVKSPRTAPFTPFLQPMDEILVEENPMDQVTPLNIDQNGVHVNTNPKSKEIKEIIDLRHVGSHRRTFYLARTIGGVYYWFHSPRVDRDHQLRKLAGDYRRKSQLEVGRRKTHGIRKLRSGRKIRM